MKNLMLLLLFIGGCMSAQNAPNDLVANATEVVSFPLTDVVTGTTSPAETFNNSCRAEASSGTVYYKFTALTNTHIAASSFLDGDTAPIINFFADDEGDITVFTAEDSNVTDESQLVQITECITDEDGDFDITKQVGSHSRTFEVQAGQTYYIEFIPSTDHKTITIEEVTPISQTEKDALMDFYNSTNGDSWFANEFWGSDTEVGSWHSIATYIVDGQEHVHALEFVGNNTVGPVPLSISNLTNLISFRFQDLFVDASLTGPFPEQLFDLQQLKYIILKNTFLEGSIPESISNCVSLERFSIRPGRLIEGNVPIGVLELDNLSFFQIRDSNLSGILPDLSSSPSDFHLQHNNYSFSDIAENVAENTTNLLSPQYTLDDAQMITELDANTVVMTVDTSNLQDTPGNTFLWYKGNVGLQDAIEDTLVLENVLPSDSGVYHCKIENSLVEFFVIERREITLLVDYLGVDDNELTTVSIYPNPVSDILNIEANAAINNVSIYNVEGRKILDFNGENSYNISTLKAGIYFVHINTENGIMTSQIVKE